LLQLTVYFSPADVAAVPVQPNDVFIVIDLIRATTTMTVQFERGARRVFAADGLEQAELAKRLFPERLLCGERHAKPLPGFDYGNSPAQFAQMDLSERDLVMTTTNGTRAFFACPAESVRLAGCFYNAQAVTALALSAAHERGSNLHIVCAAEFGFFALDDATCAGYLAAELIRQQPDLQVHESVYAATALYESYAPPKLLEYCRSARSVRAAGLEADLEYCMRVSATEVVPQVVGLEETTGLLVLARAGRGLAY
jgi:2-phosphosulfolactate phosphatase